MFYVHTQQLLSEDQSSAGIHGIIKEFKLEGTTGSHPVQAPVQHSLN